MRLTRKHGRWAERLLTAAVCWLCLALPLQAAPMPQQAAGAKGPELIAVLDVDAVGVTKAEAAALTERLREVLLKTRRFVLVDRSQLKAVLDEQALQQTGCTSEECAVQVGQILGVRKIVAGKAVRADGDIWQLSAVMVDVETAQTVDVESLRYQGGFFELLDRRIPVLAQRLAAAVSGGPAAPKAEAVRVALFPDQMGGKMAARLREYHPRVVTALEGVLGTAGRSMALAYSFYPSQDHPEAYQRFRAQPQFADLAGKAWTDSDEGAPDASYVYRTGRALGVDLVVMTRSRAGRDGRRFDLYVYDTHNLRVYHRTGTWKIGQWGLALHDAFADAIQAYIAGQPSQG